MAEYRVELLPSAWQDIDRIADYHLRMVVRHLRRELRIVFWMLWNNYRIFRLWALSIRMRP